MDQFGGSRAGMGGEIVFFDEQHRQATTGGVSSDGGAVDSAPDDEKIEPVHRPCLLRAGRVIVTGQEASEAAGRWPRRSLSSTKARRARGRCCSLQKGAASAPNRRS